jgi:hypothetical protein
MAVKGADDREQGVDPEETVEVEVERLDDSGEPQKEDLRLVRAIGPVISGLIIDVLDFATLGSAGAVLGFLLGVPAGWYLARNLGLDRKRSLYAGLACGVYCTIPVTSPIPLATLIGVWVRARQPA